MSELNKEEREKEFEILRDKIADVLSTPYHIGPHPSPAPEEIQSKKELCKIISDKYLKKQRSSCSITDASTTPTPIGF